MRTSLVLTLLSALPFLTGCEKKQAEQRPPSPRPVVAVTLSPSDPGEATLRYSD